MEGLASEMITVKDNVKLPSSYNHKSDDTLIFGHGLGFNPKSMSHSTDYYASKTVKDGCLGSGTSYFAYTARGHGASENWADVADDAQFQWKNLAGDMSYMVDHVKAKSTSDKGKVVIGGHSMGAGTSIYCAIEQGDNIDGLILVRPPTAWDTRVARKASLISSGDRFRTKCKFANKADEMVYGRVLEGTAYSDLPPLNQSNYVNITCPVLILAYKDDPAHPVSTAEGLYEELKLTNDKVEMCIVETEQDSYEKWPRIIRKFLLTLKGISLSDADDCWVPNQIDEFKSNANDGVNASFCIPLVNKAGKKRKLTDEEIFSIPNRSIHGRNCPCCE